MDKQLTKKTIDPKTISFVGIVKKGFREKLATIVAFRCPLCNHIECSELNTATRCYSCGFIRYVPPVVRVK